VLPGDRTELRSVFANERYALDGEELDEILNVVAKYA
jgi:DNA-directed RNA polymerase subunit F